MVFSYLPTMYAVLGKKCFHRCLSFCSSGRGTDQLDGGSLHPANAPNKVSRGGGEEVYVITASKTKAAIVCHLLLIYL